MKFITGNVPFNISERKARRQIRLLLARNPDVLMLDEVTRRDVPRIAAGAPGRWGVYQPHGGNNQAGSALVWDRTKLKLINRGVRIGFRGPDYYRWMLWATFRNRETKEVFSAVALHMPPYPQRGGSYRRHFNIMSDNYLKLFRDLSVRGRPVVAGGDWNFHLDRRATRWGPVTRLSSIKWTTNWRQGTACAGTGGGNSRIDGFAYNAKRVRLDKQACIARHYSDHRSVAMKVRFRSR